MASFLSSAIPTGYGGPGGSDIPPGSCTCTSGTSPSQRRRLPLLSPGGGWKDLPKPRRACSYLWRLVHHPGGEWMSFQTVAPYGHSQGPGLMIPDTDVSGTGLVLGRSILSQRRETVSKFPRQ